VDNYLPCVEGEDRLAFACSGHVGELWPSFLEKGYAKVRPRFDNQLVMQHIIQLASSCCACADQGEHMARRAAIRDSLAATRRPCSTLLHQHTTEHATELPGCPPTPCAPTQLHGSYYALEGGSVTECLTDLTGGVAHKVKLDDPDVRELATRGVWWNQLLSLLTSGSVVSCRLKTPVEEVGEHGEGIEGPGGILLNHLYTVIDAREVPGSR
jgi:hypothetical protein